MLSNTDTGLVVYCSPFCVEMQNKKRGRSTANDEAKKEKNRRGEQKKTYMDIKKRGGRKICRMNLSLSCLVTLNDGKCK